MNFYFYLTELIDCVEKTAHMVAHVAAVFNLLQR